MGLLLRLNIHFGVLVLLLAFVLVNIGLHYSEYYAPEKASISTNEFTIVTAASQELASMTNNFLCSVGPYHFHVRVFDLDGTGLCAKLLPTLNSASSCELLSGVDKLEGASEPTEVHFDSASYTENVQKRLRAYLTALTEAPTNSWLLFSDVDIVFLNDPRPFLKLDERKVDFLFSSNEFFAPGGANIGKCKSTGVALNGGFYFIRATERARQLFQKAVKIVYRHDDQTAFNKTLRRSDYDMLDCDLFANGNVYWRTSSDPNNRAVVVHANFIRDSNTKVNCFNASGLWLYDGDRETCATSIPTVRSNSTNTATCGCSVKC